MKQVKKPQLTTMIRGATLLALMTAAGLGSAEGMHSYRSLAMSASGERLAAIEAVEGEKKAPARIVVRDTATGRIASTFAQSDCAECRIEAPVWSPDGSAMALISTDAKAGTATVQVLRDGKFTRVASIKGVANTVRWSPDGRQLAFLATVGAR